jgi:2,3-bisphosphoglycerate-dependent phosphoglycerate mutase
MMSEKTLYLVRHAQSAPTHDLPDPQWPLSDRGHAQARELGRLLGELDIHEVHSSPYRRCRDTIAPFVTSAAVPLHEHGDLRERKVAHGIIDNFPEVWQRSWDDFSYALPGCESSHSTQTRVHAAVLDICARAAGTNLVINSHGNALSLLINRIDPRFHIERATAMRNPDMFRLHYRRGKLEWDADWRAPALDTFATHHDDTPFPGR